MIALLEWRELTGLVLAVLAAGYLVFVLVFPERF